VAIVSLEDDIEVVGEAENGEIALKLTRQLKPDVVLMDLQMPVMDGVEATRRIRAEVPDTKVIVLTTFNDDDYIFRGISAGAKGYLLKDDSPDDLIEAIRTQSTDRFRDKYRTADILLVDEVLAVGDEAFTRKCLDRIARMRRDGVTMVLVSHDLDLVSQVADRAVYLEGGRLVLDGPVDTVVARYRSDVAGAAEPAAAGSEVRVLEEGSRWGTGDVEIESVTVEVGGRPATLVPWGSECALRIRYRVRRPVEDFVFGLAWHAEDGAHAGGHNTHIEGARPGRLDRDGEVVCRYGRLDLAPGTYLVDAAIHAAGGLAYDYWCRAARLTVTAPVGWPGVWAPPHRWESEGPEWELPPPAEP
jgi:CheY-like chemotaxis protein